MTKKFKECQIWWSRNMGRIVIMEIDDRGVMTGKIFDLEWEGSINELCYDEDEDGKHFATRKHYSIREGGAIYNDSPDADYDLISLCADSDDIFGKVRL